jgi:hypothetical protein
MESVQYLEQKYNMDLQEIGELLSVEDDKLEFVKSIQEEVQIDRYDEILADYLRRR